MTQQPAGPPRNLLQQFPALLLVKVPGLILLPLSVLLSGALFPVTVPRLWKLGKAPRALLIFTAVAVINGIIFRFFSASNGDRVSTNANATSTIGWLLAFSLLPALFVYFSEVYTLRRLLAWVLIGGVASSIVISGGFVWKGPVGALATMLALTVCAGRINLTRLALFGAMFLGISNEGRGLALFALLTFGGTFVTKERQARIGRRPVQFTIAAALAGLALFWVFYQATLAGYLGADEQARTEKQAATGNVILGSRVEWAAAAEVFALRPVGYGLGVIAPDPTQSLAIQGVELSGGDFEADYWQRAVFADRHDFHSAGIDLWYHFGPAGVAVLIAILVLLVGNIPRAMSHLGTYGPLVLYATISALWDLLFSPMASNVSMLIALSIAMALRTDVRWSRVHEAALGDEQPQDAKRR